MARWRYKAMAADGSVYEGSVPMPDASEIEMFQRIQDLREKLQERGYQFMEARPLTKEELSMDAMARGLAKKRDERLEITENPTSGWLSLVCVPLAILLFLLLVLWRLHT